MPADLRAAQQHRRQGSRASSPRPAAPARGSAARRAAARSRRRPPPPLRAKCSAIWPSIRGCRLSTASWSRPPRRPWQMTWLSRWRTSSVSSTWSLQARPTSTSASTIRSILRIDTSSASRFCKHPLDVGDGHDRRGSAPRSGRAGGARTPSSSATTSARVSSSAASLRSTSPRWVISTVIGSTRV